MKRVLNLLLVCTMLALIPLRGLAAATVGICGAGGEDSSIAAPAGGYHSPHEHPTAPEAGDHGKKANCNACAEHCTGASFVPQTALTSLPDLAGAQRAVPGERFAAGHVPEHLDPPPLAL